ncbi:nuclear transport factor 2 family protein [Streptomyces sp. R11]|uniref:Nuclear transport factor 2 family protein n=1 Tax=Streptomyces sp. R11 TaxID=3238625 RepID=A0AB39NEG5_9ACTN
MTDHPHIAVFHRVLAAFSVGDMDALAQEFHPDVVWHIGGRNLLTGDYQGPTRGAGTPSRCSAGSSS